MLKFLLEKEFKQIKRNPFLPKMILVFPCVMMLILPWAANMEVKDIKLCVVDNDHSSYSDRLVRKSGSSGYFSVTASAVNYQQALQTIESNQADIILEIEPDFEKNLIREGRANVMISANAVNGTKGGLGSSYLNSIIADFSSELRQEKMNVPSKPNPTIDMPPLYRYNAYLDFKYFMVPAIMVQLMTILCGFLPALNIVGEKENSTIEQLNVTPINKFTFILAKLIPYWVIGLTVLTLCFGLARFVYGIIPVGHLISIYALAAIFILAVSGLGLVISNYSDTMQQAMFVMFFFLVILILMSGLFTPVSSMPDWAQNIALFNPLKYFIEVMRSVYLKGSSVFDLSRQFYALLSFALFFNTWAVLSYKKRG